MNVGINPIHKTLQSSCHSSALVPSLIPGFAALRYLSVFLTSLVQDPNILLLSFWPTYLVLLVALPLALLSRAGTSGVCDMLFAH